MDYRIFYLKEQLESQINLQFCVKYWAETLNLSSQHLQKLFKSDTGMPIGQYLKRLRLEKACKELENTHKSIKEISNCVGITDQSHFVRDFKKKYGVTPSEFRKKNHRVFKYNNAFR